jgi:hypothetical protein
MNVLPKNKYVWHYLFSSAGSYPMTVPTHH